MQKEVQNINFYKKVTVFQESSYNFSRRFFQKGLLYISKVNSPKTAENIESKVVFRSLVYLQNDLINLCLKQKSDAIWQMMMRLMYTIRHECPICRAIYLRHGYFLPKIFSISSQKLDYNTTAAMGRENLHPRTIIRSSLILMYFDMMSYQGSGS